MLAAVLIGICTFLFFNEAKLGSMDIPAGIDLRQGIDLKGGIYALLYPDKENVTDEELQAAKAVIDRRLDNRNIFDRNIYVESDKKRIVVEYPSKGGADSYDINELGSIGSLTFREVVEKQVDKAGNYLPLDDMIILTGADIKSAKMEIYEGAYVVAFELYEEGAGKFAEATTRLAGVGRIGIFMDQELISAPSVDDPITEGSGIIRGSFTAKEASNLAGNIMAGALPFKMVARQVNQISPSLGENALKVTVWAGMLALLLICLFMTGYYRLPGVVASLAIMSLAVFQVDLISWAKIPLTLPGIAGIILSIGMGVDANVIIYERIKEELKNGKTISTAVDLGFKRAFSAIIDSNVTTIITGVVLYIMTTGPIKGFAVTLVLGVLLSFLTAITISRTLIRFTLGLGFGRNKWLYGGQGRA
ncbi:MAG TPA: protein translocase subunit SecD [Clostridiales bacterium]|nr:protein translocase subunit SecD [Clostridiales bacterium]